MRRLIYGIAAVIAATLLGQAFARAQQAVAVWQPNGFQQATVTTATSLTVPLGTRMAIVCAEAQIVRYRDDGTAPTTTVGMPIPVGGCITYSGNLATIQFISAVAAGIIDVSYYK